MKKIIAFLIFVTTFSFSYSQDKPAYIIYNKDGKKVSYGKMIKTLAQQNVVLFGEIHNNPISHWLEFNLAKDLSQNKTLTLGAEMFEADNQSPLNNYVSGKIDNKTFTQDTRLWPNYDTDYSPLVEFAKERNLNFIATNIPRKYASLVFKKDFISLDSLTSEEKSWIAPLPIKFEPNLPTYQNILKMMGGHGSELLVKAQAIKDATMAHFILANYKPDNIFLHFNGAYHSDDFEGILWYLKQENADLKYATLSTVSQDNISSLAKENIGKADFIICVDSSMTNTY
ncbi:iron-regulated protein [Pedobacter psychrophilus]|uniref:Iron-regulated protein n=1 Tax=Pedobacter psychrophilus TaxID=1826909 RepID=A0A179DNH3_9SPHI|nr:ChaN family lipoprotein [Pedobacter psychrophilus]OAQ42342.1 iron-regulated protein [Pedobacter psychrophilus]